MLRIRTEGTEDATGDYSVGVEADENSQWEIFLDEVLRNLVKI